GSSFAFLSFISGKPFFQENENSNRFTEDAAFVIAARANSTEVSSLLNSLGNFNSSTQKSILVGLEKGLKRAPDSFKKSAALSRALESASGKSADELKSNFEKIKESLKGS